MAISPFCPRLTFGFKPWSVVTLIYDISGLPQEWLLPVYFILQFLVHNARMECAGRVCGLQVLCQLK